MQDLNQFEDRLNIEIDTYLLVCNQLGLSVDKEMQCLVWGKQSGVNGPLQVVFLSEICRRF